MATLLLPYLIIPVPQSQMRQICLEVDGTKHLVNHFNIVFVKGNDNQCSFHIIDTLREGGTRVLVPSKNLGYFEQELGHDFVRPNQSFLTNRFYVCEITDEGYVKLHYPKPHPDIYITKTFRDDFYDRLNNRPAE